MERITFCMAMVLACAVQAEEVPWTPMSGEDIRAALTDSRLSYGEAWQAFYASGRTLYEAGAESWGNWRVQDDRYCSQWPPSDLWACYAMQRQGDRFRFLGERDDVTEGVYKE